MKTLIRTLVLTLVAIPLSSFSAGLTTDSIAMAETPSSASAGLQSCLVQSHRLGLVVLMDTSGSLADSDRLNLRVTALKSVIARLAQINTESHIATDTTVIAFDTTAQIIQPWTQVTKATSSALLKSANSFADRNKGALTNYIAALHAAWDAVIQSRSLHPTSCSAVLWFTDGALDLGPTVSHKSGVAMMCRTNGPADVLARNGVFTFAVGLGNTKQGGMSSAAAAELSSYVTGSPNGITDQCGSFVSTQTGSFFKVSHPENLLFALQSAVDPSISTNPDVINACRESGLCSTTSTINLGPEINGFRITAVALAVRTAKSRFSSVRPANSAFAA